ncbi:MAG: helix-turn-helix domain-containing protein [Oscillospiraceae bacterium]
MAKKNSRNTKGRIISAAWKLFYEQGYEGTTVEDIVFEIRHLQGLVLPLF